MSAKDIKPTNTDDTEVEVADDQKPEDRKAERKTNIFRRS